GLADIEKSKAGLAFHRRFLVDAQRAIETPGFVLLIAEILDGLEVQEAVDGLGRRLAVALVHGAAELETPFGYGEGEPDVTGDGCQCCRGKTPIEHPPQNARHQRYLEQCR